MSSAAATSSHPYPFDSAAFAVGQDHGRRNRYSLAQSTGSAWVYWYGQGRATTDATAVQ